MRKLLKSALCLLMFCCPLLLEAQYCQQDKCAPDLPPPRSLSFGPDTVSITFLGDVMMHKGQIDNALREDGSYAFPTYF